MPEFARTAWMPIASGPPGARSRCRTDTPVDSIQLSQIYTSQLDICRSYCLQNLIGSNKYPFVFNELVSGMDPANVAVDAVCRTLVPR